MSDLPAATRPPRRAFVEGASPASLIGPVCDHVARWVRAAATEPGGWIALPGGSTPGPFLAALADDTSLPWASARLTVTDERLVPAEHPASNFGALTRALGATGASVAPLDPVLFPTGAAGPLFDLVWTGVGEDGHTASLFPGQDGGREDGAGADRWVIDTHPDPLPAAAPFPRRTLTYEGLLATRDLIVVGFGPTKRAVLERALAEGAASPLPIGRLLARATCPVTIYWSVSA